jgi:acetoin:2,6-dichlorophenolindophenol oxidoreductase subunit alpha
MRGTDQVAVAFFGDGTTNIGAFHEALNLAKVWELPVVFVCENNLYMEYTPIDLVTAVEHPAADRAAAYGLERSSSTATTPTTCSSMPEAALDQARSGGGPSMIEAVTYRSGGHSRADPAKYRPPEEVQKRGNSEIRSRSTTTGCCPSGPPRPGSARSSARWPRPSTPPPSSPSPGGSPGEDALLTEVYADGGSRWRN